MQDPYSTTADHPRGEAGAALGPARDSFIPDRRLDSVGSENAELRWLLQQRLRAASVVLVGGFGLFFLRSLLLHRLESLTVLFHALILILLTLSLGLLSSTWRPTLRELRIYEVGLFATVTVFFMAGQYVQMLRYVRWPNSMLFLASTKSTVLCSLLVMLSYAIFIPNTWRRAAAVIVPMAVVPLAVLWILALLHPQSAVLLAQVASLDQVTEHALFLLLGAFTAIFGAGTMHALRLEVREARMLNQYRLGRKLGGGGMGEVYLAEHRMLKRPCAVKLIRPERAADAHTLARFEREVRATAQLSHWNTILIFDYGRHDDGTFYYAMEYLPGLSLDVLVRRHGPMPASRVIYLLRQACDALHEAHQNGLVHRDIKPGNLFAALRGGHHDVTKILDFGLVKTLQGGDGIQLSREDTVAGSPLYIAPEQVLLTQAPDRRADVYSLGAVAYFLLTGEPPFTGNNAMEVMIAHTRDTVELPSRRRPDVPPDLERVILRCLEKRPDDRFPDMPSLAAALAACTDADGWSPEQAATWWREHPNIPGAEPSRPVAPLADQSGTSGVPLANSSPTGSLSGLEPAEAPRRL